MPGILAAVTTRGGAAGIQNRYVRNLAGTPLIAYSLREAEKSERIERIVLSTDSKEVARAAGLYSTKVIVRPDDLAGEDVFRVEIVKHALEELRNIDGFNPAIVVVLPASCPLRRARHIDAVIEKMEKTGADSVVTVCPVQESPYRMVTLDGDKAVPFGVDAEGITNERDLPQVYRLTNAVIALKPPLLYEQDRLYGGDMRAVVMTAAESVEVTDRYSFMRAEAVLKDRKKDIFR